MKGRWGVLLLFVTSSLGAQISASPYPPRIGVPAPGTPLRMALMDAMRPEVERIMGAQVQFVVQTIRVLGTQAYFSGYPVHRGGRSFTDQEIARAFDGYVFDGVQMMTWLVQRNGMWQVRELLINQSDVGYMHWCADRSMRALMGATCPSRYD